MKVLVLRLVLICIMSLACSLSQASSKKLVAYLGYLPVLSETESKGSFIDLVRAIDDVYTEGEISIYVLPINRSKHGIITGEADLALPAFRHPREKEVKLPYRYSTSSFGKVVHVMYMNKNKKFDVKELQDNEKAKKSKLKIQGVPIYWPFPCEDVRSLEASLKSVDSGRIDGLIWAQEETDFALKKLNLKNVHRFYFGEYDDVFIIQKGLRGDYVDSIITSSINKLKKSGRLKKLYENIHRPYDNWQPD